MAGIRYLTGLVPFVGEFAEDPEGGRRLSLQLMSEDQAKEAFDAHKEQIGGDIVKMKDEIQQIIQEAKLASEPAAVEEELVVPEAAEMPDLVETSEALEEA